MMEEYTTGTRPQERGPLEPGRVEVLKSCPTEAMPVVALPLARVCRGDGAMSRMADVPAEAAQDSLKRSSFRWLVFPASS